MESDRMFLGKVDRDISKILEVEVEGIRPQSCWIWNGELGVWGVARFY